MLLDIAFAVSLALNPYPLTFPPEKVCERQFRLAEAHYKAVAELHCVWGGWALQQELDRTKRWMDVWWAAWWVTWRGATPEDRARWSGIYSQRLEEWLEH